MKSFIQTISDSLAARRGRRRTRLALKVKRHVENQLQLSEYSGALYITHEGLPIVEVDPSVAIQQLVKCREVCERCILSDLEEGGPK